MIYIFTGDEKSFVRGELKKNVNFDLLKKSFPWIPKSVFFLSGHLRNPHKMSSLLQLTRNLSGLCRGQFDQRSSVMSLSDSRKTCCLGGPRMMAGLRGLED